MHIHDKRNHLILIGFMGTGKSTVAQYLAEQLAYPYVDLDQEIINLAARSIPDIFAEEGEDAFRNYESEALSKVSEFTSPVVLATGGGAVLREGNCRAMLDSGCVIALTAEEHTIVSRVQNDRNRPLLQGEASKRVSELMEQRRGKYDFAHLSVKTDDRDVQQLAEEIVAFYRQYSRYEKSGRG
ncbi:shikimate kinase [Paenibacillus agilis]|nr:shikimate kinase [Paenibacillus agilis]